MNLFGLVLGRQLAIQQGLPEARATQIGVLAAIPDNLATGLVLSTVMTRNATPTAPAQPAPVTSGAAPTTTTGGTGQPPLDSAPTIEGSALVGEKLHLNRGRWPAGTSPQFQWLRDTAPIAGQSGRHYRVVADDAGHSITCRVTAWSGAGSTSQVTNAIDIPPAPVNTREPVISGRAVVGQTLECNPGSWEHVASFQFQWFKRQPNDQHEHGQEIKGVSAARFEITADLVGARLSCRVTALGAGTTTEQWAKKRQPVQEAAEAAEAAKAAVA